LPLKRGRATGRAPPLGLRGLGLPGALGLIPGLPPGPPPTLGGLRPGLIGIALILGFGLEPGGREGLPVGLGLPLGPVGTLNGPLGPFICLIALRNFFFGTVASFDLAKALPLPLTRAIRRRPLEKRYQPRVVDYRSVLDLELSLDLILRE